MMNLEKGLNTMGNRRSIIMRNIQMLMMAVVMAAGLIAASISLTPSEVRANDTEGEAERYVFDDADLLTNAEIEELNKLCKDATINCDCDFVILTISKDLDYSEFDSYMDSFLTTKGFGSDAIIYGIDMTSRADRIWTRGKARTDINQEDLDAIREEAEDKLTDGEYYEAFKKFVNKCNLKLTNDFSDQLFYALPIKLFISLVVAIVAVLIAVSNAKAKMTVGSTTYTKNHQFKVLHSEDHFINTTVVTRHIESSHSGGGGGGGNSGSGGHF